MSTELKLAVAKLPRATHSNTMSLGDVQPECDVLADGTALLHTRGFIAVLQGKESGPGSSDLARFIERIPNKPEGFAVIPVSYVRKNGRQAKGVSAADAIVVMQLYSNALVEGTLHTQQKDIGKRCARMLFTLAGKALVDRIYDATGYHVRTSADDLLDRLYAKVMLPAPAQARDDEFPSEFFRELSRLYQRAYVPGKNPPFFKAHIRRYVYDEVDRELARRIKVANPNPRSGSLHHNHFTDEALPILRRVIEKNITVMRGSASPRDFRMRHAREFHGSALQLAFGSA